MKELEELAKAMMRLAFSVQVAWITMGSYFANDPFTQALMFFVLTHIIYVLLTYSFSKQNDD